MECLKRSIDEDQEPVLVKLVKDNSPFPDIHVDKNEFKIGRAKCNDEVIADVLISRNHAILKCEESGDWTITHLSSTVTLLNEEPLEVGVPTKLKLGDRIQFSASAEFTYVFTLLPKSIKNKRQRLDECLLETLLTQQKSFAQTQETQRKELEERLQTKQSEQLELKTQLDELRRVLKNQELEQDKTQDLNNKIIALQQQIKAGNDAEEHLQRSYDDLLSVLETERRKFEERLNEERQKWQTALDTSKQEKESVEKNMREQMEKWREQQQAEWAKVIENLVKQEQAQEKLLSEKTQLEQKLKETENALKEQAAITEQLQSTANNVANMEISRTVAPECIFVQLLDDGTTGQMEILETIDLTVDSPCTSNNHEIGIFSKVGDIMEDQLTCSVCSELFVKAVTLNCTHSFCHHCIITWMKKKRECPVCRAMIIAVNRSIVLDNFIEQMVENLSPQLRARRKELLAERKAIEKPFVKIKVKGRK